MTATSEVTQHAVGSDAPNADEETYSEIGDGATRLSESIQDVIATCADCGAFILNRHIAYDLCTDCVKESRS